MPENNESTSLNLSDLNQPPQQNNRPEVKGKAARAANELFDQANYISGSSSNTNARNSTPTELAPGHSVHIGPVDTDTPPPKLSQAHDFGPIAPTISSSSKTESKPLNPIESLTQSDSAQAKSSAPTQKVASAQAPEQSLESESRLARLSRFLKLKKIFSKRNLTYLGIGLVSFLVFYLIFNFQNILLQVNYAFHKPQPQPAISLPDATASKKPQAQAAPPGNIISIPKINVTAPVVLESSTDEKTVQLALRNGVVHYGQSGVFGQPGNAVIVGHSSMDPWSPGNYKYIFALLEKVGVGDQIQINYEQKKYVYQVTETKVVAPTDLSVLNQTSEPTLTLITCTPVGTNWRRFIVHAKQVEPLTSPQIADNSKSQPAAQPVADLPGKSPFFLDKVKGFFKHLFGQG